MVCNDDDDVMMQVSQAAEKQNAARLAYERLLTDKTAVDIKLNQAGE